MSRTIHGRPLVAAFATGVTLSSETPLSLWGGLDPDTGEIIDRRHPLSGHNVQGRILVIPQGRGSCSASGVLLEAIRNGTAPAGIVVSAVDPILSLGAILGDELFDIVVPVILVTPDERRSIPSDQSITVNYAGYVEWQVTR